MGRALCIFLLAVLTAFSAACGGGGSSSGSSVSLASGDVAVVDGTHITKSQLDHAITLRVKGMEAQKQTPPKVGTTDYTTNVVQPTLQHLVQGAEVRNIANALNVSASADDVKKAIQASVTQYYGGDQAKFQADVDRYGLTAADLNYEFQTSVLETKITNKLTDQVAVTDKDVQDYYDQNKASYKSTSDSRVVDYALFPDKASAEAAQKKLAGGAGFSDVAAGTIDTSANHEPFTATKGQIDKAFEQSAFTLPTNQLSPLVKVDKAYATSNLGRQVPARLLLPHPADRRRGEGRHPAVVRLGQGPDPHAAALDAEAVARDERPSEARGGPEEGDHVRHRLRAAADVDRASRHLVEFAAWPPWSPSAPAIPTSCRWRHGASSRPPAPWRCPTTSRSPRGWASTASRSTPTRPWRPPRASASGACSPSGTGRTSCRAARPCATSSSPTPWSGSSA